jgi:hypothetical protein
MATMVVKGMFELILKCRTWLKSSDGVFQMAALLSAYCYYIRFSTFV